MIDVFCKDGLPSTWPVDVVDPLPISQQLAGTKSFLWFVKPRSGHDYEHFGVPETRIGRSIHLNI